MEGEKIIKRPAIGAVDNLNVLKRDISSLREMKSSKPQQLIQRILFNRHLLVIEIAAVRIQSICRGYLSRTRVHNIRMDGIAFQLATHDLNNVIIEEVIIIVALQLSLSTIETNKKMKQMKEDVSDSLIWIRDKYIEEFMSTLCELVVRETIQDAISRFMIHKPLQKTAHTTLPLIEEVPTTKHPNIFILLMKQLMDEVADDSIPSVVVSTIMEEVFLYRKSVIIYGVLRDEVTTVLISEVLHQWNHPLIEYLTFDKSQQETISDQTS